MLAGFVLGFTVSTLWEWLYYRGQRLRWRADAGVPSGSNAFGNAGRVGSWRDPDMDRADAQRAASEALPWETPAYRSSGVFLESEKEVAISPLPSTEPLKAEQHKAEPFVAQPSASSTADEIRSTVEHDRQNPAARQLGYEPVERTPAPTLSEEFLAAMAIQNVPPPESQTQIAVPLRPTTDAPAMVNCDTPPTRPQELPSIPLVAPSAPNPEPVPASAAPATKPAPTRSNGYPDDLTKIQGIGEAYKHRLYAASIYTWQQVANSEVETLRSITKAKPNARPDEWKTQAQELATKFNRLEALYEGPVPDDLSRIDGIGPTYADTLYHAGICTYEQLATATPAELTVILPTPAIGNEFNFTSWIRQATQLAQAKQKNMNLLR
ncbi:hypothetical protein BH10CHL1_BH10CHL1_24270 [soil metagenome]